MAKKIFLEKLIVDLDSSDDTKEAILQYRINEDGVISGIKSVNVKNGINLGDMKKLVKMAKKHANTSEGIDE